MAIVEPFKGILPAMQVPFRADLSIDEAELRSFTEWLVGHKGIGGLVTNGHTGEVWGLSPKERAEVTRIVADQAGERMPIISGINCESIPEACEHAGMAKEAGAKGLLIMPPHVWLRFGMREEHVIDYFTEIGKAVDINLVVHVYPAWTKTSYSEELLAALVKIPQVTTVKLGTREMSKYQRDIEAIRGAGTGATILTCHDEYLLPSLVQGLDGALVGFASFIPDMITALYQAVLDGDMKTAQELQWRINPLKHVVYAAGEPSSDAHARMKVAMVLAGRFNSMNVRPPIRIPEGEAYDAIVKAVTDAGLMKGVAA